jgi:hypothetical protein
MTAPDTALEVAANLAVDLLRSDSEAAPASGIGGLGGTPSFQFELPPSGEGNRDVDW